MLMMGGEGLTEATRYAILNANYIAQRLSPHYPLLFKGAHGRVAHECIIDIRPFKDTSGVTVDDVAKRLIDHGFHPPTIYFPLLVDTFPDQLRADDFERFYLAVNRVEPSLIRVEADEVTYNLHIILRFELEQALIEGRMEVEDLPEAWNAKMGEYIGITPPTDANGVMQDIHWPSGGVGYFPTYSLGNLIGAQLYYTMRETYPDFDDRVAAGDLGFILGWLRENVHRHGHLYSTNELLQRATGKPLDETYFGRYLAEKYGPIYGLSLP